MPLLMQLALGMVGAILDWQQSNGTTLLAQLSEITAQLLRWREPLLARELRRYRVAVGSRPGPSP